MRDVRIFLAAAIVGLPVICSAQATMPRAADLLTRMTATSKPAAAVAEPVTFADRAAALAKTAASLAPEEAARRWLELFDSKDSGRESMTANLRYASLLRAGSTDSLMGALPPPPAWNALATAIRARPLPDAGGNRRRELALRTMADLLSGDQESLKKNTAELEKIVANDPTLVYAISSQTNSASSLANAILGVSEEPLAVEEAFQRTISNANDGSDSVQVPDLVTLVGNAKAEELLRKAIAVEGQLEIDTGDATKKLAQKLALELVDQMKVPQWGLVSYDSMELYEAITKRFPPPATQPSRGIFSALSMRSSTPDRYSWQRSLAAQSYLVGLIVAGRSTEAVTLIKQTAMDDGPDSYSMYAIQSQLNEIQRAGYSAKVFDTIQKILSENPDLPLWPAFQSVSASAGKTAEMLELARSAAKREGLSREKQSQIQSVLLQALLAADQVDEAVPMLIARLDSKDAENQRRSDGIKLAQLGTELNKPEWVQRGVAAARANVPTEEHSYSSYSMSSVVSILTANKLYAQALELVGDELSKNAAQQRDIKDLENRMRQRDSSRDLLVAALGVYHAAGRHADVLELLQSAPNWKVSDLSELLAVRSDGVPVGYIAAAALADVGKNDQARAILHAMLDANGGYDPAYALLVKIDGPAALAKLDELFSRDRFEERPLIWRAEILRQQRKLDEAEKIARQAISIDPSDGEQPRGDRMRVYAVLADILADQGNPEGAKAFREVVAAIRMSEDADRLHSAGLLKRAVELYQKALTHFADAYCIQSRLAVQLSQMGMTRAAAEHYQRAYELMPDSFGRVESHCFGCEQAFAGQEAQSIAERVFTKLAADQPRKPQVHYLLGYLREAQGRYPEALASFKTATQLDPDYLNAWKHLTELGDHVHIPAAEMDSAALNILRLDPLQRHVHAPYVEVRSLARLWEVVADASTKYPPKVESLLPLQASMVARKDTDKATQLTLEEYTPASIQSAPLPTPADAIASTTAMQIIRSLMSANQEQ